MKKMKNNLNPKSYELVKGVWVTDADDIAYNNGKRLDTSKFPNFKFEHHKDGYPTQEVLDKLGKNRGWAVCSSWLDADAKSFNFKVMINAKETEIRTVKFEDACDDYHWKSFKVSENGFMIIPKSK